jgi:hypothetical protein
MAQNQSFCPQGNTFLVTTSITTLTAAAQTVSFAPPPAVQPAAQATGMNICPPQVRISAPSANTNPVFVSITSAVRTAAVPGANPSLEFPVNAGEDIVLTLPQLPTVASIQTLQINTISVGVSQTLYVTFGEGLKP